MAGVAVAENPKKKARLTSAMARYSEKSIHDMSRLLEGKEHKSQPSGAAKRRMREAIGPVCACYEQVTAPNKDPSQPDVQWAFANIRALLRCMASSCPSFVTFLQSQEQPLRCILSHDECTAGNVLATEQRQKVTLCYLSLECMAKWGDSPTAWLPISAISHAQVANTRGGMGNVHRRLIEAWAQQRLEEPFELVPGVSISLVLSCMVADHDAQRGSLCAKGSAGLKPCAFCINCIAKSAQGTAERDAQFRTIAESDMSLFQQHSTEALRQFICKALQHPKSKAEHELQERVLGYRIERNNMWMSPTCLQCLPLERYVNDSMHCYFSNGICCVAIALLLDAVQTVTKKTIADIKRAVLDAGWLRHRSHSRHGENQYWTKRLFTEAYFGSSMYKGSAKQTLALLSLLRWVCESAWLHVPGLETAAACFLKLCACVECIRTIGHTKSFDKLHALQTEHQKAFVKQWGDYVRPKHHHRLHLPFQYRALNLCPTMWGTESKHRDYKGLFAANFQQWLTEEMGGSAFSTRLLPRLALRHMEMWNERPLAASGYSLDKAFPESEVLKETDLTGVVIAPKCRIGLLDLQEGDIILWGACENAGTCHCFIERNSELYVLLSQYAYVSGTESLRTFRITNNKVIYKWNSLENPKTCSWWRRETANSIVHCLP